MPMQKKLPPFAMLETKSGAHRSQTIRRPRPALQLPREHQAAPTPPAGNEFNQPERRNAERMAITPIPSRQRLRLSSSRHHAADLLTVTANAAS